MSVSVPSGHQPVGKVYARCGKRDRLVGPVLCNLYGWVLVLIANASKECRDRLLRLLTQPEVLDLGSQYVLGQDC